MNATEEKYQQAQNEPINQPEDIEDTPKSEDLDEKNVDTESETKPKHNFARVNIRKPKEWNKKTYEQIRKDVREQLVDAGWVDVPDEVVDKFVDDIAQDVIKKKHRQSVFSALRLALVATLLTFIALVGSLLIDVGGKFVGKAEITHSIANTIHKGVVLDDIKMVYTKEKNVTVNNFWPILKPHLYYEKADLTLLKVLQDLKASLLVQDDLLSNEQSEFLVKINSLLAEYNKVNPFDGLDEQDLRDFKGLSYKLDKESYKKIEDEVLSLTSSMKLKNNLIHQYLSSSNTSLYISIAAFIFSVIISIWQLLTSRKSSQKQLIYEAMKEHNIAK
ncbi:hypothetical protein [Vibrio kanaloae]|uniref:hypothetical protein n=1 Tax=Vibrio kanaloae TaxID=170673 RepID=UPI0011B4C9DE|nr:hypothetical protein [Vibrio kanaloae]